MRAVRLAAGIVLVTTGCVGLGVSVCSREHGAFALPFLVAVVVGWVAAFPGGRG